MIIFFLFFHNQYNLRIAKRDGLSLMSTAFYQDLQEKCILLKKYLEDSNILRIFAASESTTLPVDQRTRVELFLYIR